MGKSAAPYMEQREAPQDDFEDKVFFQKTLSSKANLDFADYQKRLLDKVRECLPKKAEIMILGDRFSGSVDMIRYCQKAGWHYRFEAKVF